MPPETLVSHAGLAAAGLAGAKPAGAELAGAEPPDRTVAVTNGAINPATRSGRIAMESLRRASGRPTFLPDWTNSETPLRVNDFSLRSCVLAVGPCRWAVLVSYV